MEEPVRFARENGETDERNGKDEKNEKDRLVPREAASSEPRSRAMPGTGA